MQKITLILTLIQLCLSNNLMAQSKYFEKSFGWLLVHNGHIVSKTTDGYFISCDAIGMSGDNWNVYSIFVDEYGELTDSVHYGFPSNDYGAAILGGIITEYGYALCGYAGNNQNLVVGNQCYLLQTNSDGSLIDSIWTGANNSVSYTIARTPDNGYLLGGYRRIIDNNGNFSYPYLLRLDANFNTVWDTTYQLTNFFGYFSKFVKIIPNYTDSTYYLVGNINNFEDVNDVLWLHINEQGHILHQRVITEPEYFSEEVVSDFIKTTDGDFVLGITKYNNGPAKAGIILKLSPNGDTIRWAKKVFDLGVVSKIYQLPDSSYLVAGEASPSATNPPFNAAIAHVSANGDTILWQRSYGGSSPDYIYDFIPTSDGGYFFVGRTESPDLGVPTGGANVYLL
jgi:hypothetical protein